MHPAAGFPAPIPTNLMGNGSAPHKQRNEAGKWPSKYRSIRTVAPTRATQHETRALCRCVQMSPATWHRQCRLLRESGCWRPRVGSDRCWLSRRQRRLSSAGPLRRRRRYVDAVPALPTRPRRCEPLASHLPDDGSVPEMGGWRWLHTPGHTPGHMALWREADRTVNAGDAFITTRRESAYAVTVQEPEMHGPPMYCRKAACYFLASLPAAHATRSRHDPKPEQS